ncbi:hypothetical protein [Microvirga sp. CF3016]|uniref:hypothetical protein n=1 Tax=Microvirga sp. CF3016 TaxID=3110181 RepID=UPI002E7691F9|nr:hypothetical protein [Microvirga sp. CF3016]MEE1611124.1 hypothetical protein [Microvirga sp. CF3016]
MTDSTDRFLDRFVIGILFCAALMGAWLFFGPSLWASPEPKESQKETNVDDPAAKVQVKVMIDLAACPKSSPLIVEIINGSEKAIDYTRFQIQARKPNYSTHIFLAQTGFGTDRIIKPNERWVECQEFSALVSDDEFPKLILKAYDVRLGFSENE